MWNQKQILIVHGGDTYKNYSSFLESLNNKIINLDWIVSRRDWKNEIQNQLWDRFLVYTPQMPNKQNAKYKERKILFEKIIDKIGDNFILIWHSLWAKFIVKYLSENTIYKKIDKTLLLGTPFDNEMEADDLNWFMRKWSLQKFSKQAGKIYFYHSEDDFAVPFSHLTKYQKALPYANFRIMKDRNHFLQEIVPELNFDILYW